MSQGVKKVVSQQSQIACLNPFSMVEDVHEDMEKLKAIIAKMASPSQQLDDFRMCAIEAKIMAVFSVSGKETTISMVAGQCLNDADSRIRDVGIMLFPFTKNGPYGSLFNGERNVDSIYDPAIQGFLGKKDLRSLMPLLFVVKKPIQSVDEMVKTAGPQLVIAGLQALRRERISAYLAASAVEIQRGKLSQNEELFGIEEVESMLRTLGS